jgi:hypothetical protein
MPRKQTSTFAESTSMNKASKWAKHLVLPVATIAVLFVAGSVVTKATIGNATSTGLSVSAVPLVPPAAVSSAALESFCEQKWGELSNDGSVCRFTQRLQVNLTHVGSGVAVTNIPVVPLDTLRVEASSPADVVVGNETYGAGAGTLLLASSGYLSFQAAPGQTVFSVQRVMLERCYSASGVDVSSVECPARN